MRSRSRSSAAKRAHEALRRQRGEARRGRRDDRHDLLELARGRLRRGEFGRETLDRARLVRPRGGLRTPVRVVLRERRLVERLVVVRVASERNARELGPHATLAQRRSRHLGLQRARLGLHERRVQPREHVAGDDERALVHEHLAQDAGLHRLHDLDLRARNEPPVGDDDDVETAEAAPRRRPPRAGRRAHAGCDGARAKARRRAAARSPARRARELRRDPRHRSADGGRARSTRRSRRARVRRGSG